jgi:phosphatidylinositol glycan class S
MWTRFACESQLWHSAQIIPKLQPQLLQSSTSNFRTCLYPPHRPTWMPINQPRGRNVPMDTDKPTENVAVASSPPPTTKEPPPQSQDGIRTSQLVILSFWAIVIFLGLPIWWKTTSIYRANLPLKAMTDLGNGKICKPTFPLRIAVETDLGFQESQNLVKTTQHALDDLNDFSAHHLRLFLPDRPANTSDVFLDDEERIIVSDHVALLVRLKPAALASPSPSSKLHVYSPVLDVFYSSNQLPASSSSASALSTYIAKQLQAIFAEEQASLAYMMGSTEWATENSHKTLSPEVLETQSRRSTRSFKYAPTYHVTFSLITPSSIPSDWQIEEALDTYISPLLKSLSSISNFTVDTQVQLNAYFSSSINPEYDETRKAWLLKKEDLSGFINAAEWPLNPNIGAGPTINFILYIPAPSQSPLLIHETEGTSWLIPQWGGIQILNTPSSAHTTKTLTKDMLEPAMHTFSNHLLSLLGLPHSPNSLPVKLSTLTRIHTSSLIHSASSTLGALARLTLTLPSIAIPNAVAASVSQTIAHLNSACADLREGNFVSALENARVAEKQAETAFFERSMVGQVYFPDEHKVAVYLPLLGPVAVPLVLSAVREIRRLRDLRR